MGDVDRARGRRGLGWVLALLVAGGPAARAAGECAAATPEETYGHLRAAAAAQDVAGLMGCLEPDARAEMALGLVLAGGMLVALSGVAGELAVGFGEAAGEAAGKNKEQQAAAQGEASKLASGYEAILERHGLTERMAADEAAGEAAAAASPAEVLAGIDSSALIGDLVAFLDAAGEGGWAISDSLPSGELGDLVIEGEEARATVDGQPLRFRRLDGRWYVAAQAAAGTADEPAAAPVE